jgi:hypothetical protein
MEYFNAPCQQKCCLHAVEIIFTSIKVDFKRPAGDSCQLNSMLKERQVIRLNFFVDLLANCMLR